MSNTGSANRRMVLTVLGLGALGAGVSALVHRLPGPALEFTELSDPEGYRRLSGGEMTGTAAIFAGLEDPAPTPSFTRPTSLCDALFETSMRPGLAVFTDFNCSVCRRTEPQVLSVARASSPALQITWHELPRLAPSSEVAARGALAAGLQGGYEAFRTRLMQSRLLASEAYIAELAESIGLDVERMIADMTHPEVDRHLARSEYLARRFAIPGTPSMVVGRTLVVGALPERELARLIELERMSAPLC